VKRSLAVVGALGCLLLQVACSADAQEAPPLPTSPDLGTADNGSLHDGSQVLTPELADVADVRDGELRFPKELCQRLSGIKLDTIILGDRKAPNAPADNGGNNPEGFLRRVRSVTCDDRGVIVKTDPATLPEAFDDLKLDWGFNLPSCKDVSGPSLGVEYGGTLMDYSGTARTADGRDIPFTASAGMNASLCLSPRITLKADVGFMKLNSFEVSATGQLEAKLLLSAAVKLAPSLDAATQAELAGKALTKSVTATIADKSISLGSIGASGVKLPISAKYVATVSCDFSFTAPVEVKVGAKATASMTAGITYQNGKLAPKSEKGITFEAIPPTFDRDGMMRAVCSVNPTLELRVFGMATGQIGAKAYGSMGASQSCGGKDPQGVTQRLTSGDVEAGLSAGVVAKLDVFGVKKWKKECTLFSESHKLPYDRAYPSPGGASATCAVASPLALPPSATANPAACFSDDDAQTTTPALIPGTCTHDVCSAGEKLGQACDECTMKVCAVDAYCCDTYWGLSCFDQVQKLCGKTCTQ
jgi:hypothetical protein